MFISVVDVTPEGRIAKFIDGFDTLAEAEAHVASVRADFPAAFAAPIQGGVGELMANVAAKTVIVVPIPDPPVPTDAEIDAEFYANNPTLARLRADVDRLGGPP